MGTPFFHPQRQRERKLPATQAPLAPMSRDCRRPARHTISRAHMRMVMIIICDIMGYLARRLQKGMGDMDILRELRESGLKVTIPRLRILQLFQEGGIKHLSADDVYKLLLAEKIDVGLATIYRVLMQFAEAGILFRRHFESGHAVFELNEGQHHDHLVCTGCGKVDEFVDEGIELRQNEIAAERGFVLHEHALSLYGTCAQCTAKKIPPRRA
eukprot:gene19126-22906_t